MPETEAPLEEWNDDQGEKAAIDFPTLTQKARRILFLRAQQKALAEEEKKLHEELRPLMVEKRLGGLVVKDQDGREEGKVRYRASTRFTKGDVAALRELLGEEKAAPFLKTSVTVNGRRLHVRYPEVAETVGVKPVITENLAVFLPGEKEKKGEADGED